MDSSHKHHVAPWYRDAVFYGVDLARFRASDGNGYGDLKGLTQSLGYLEWSGVDAIWLQPFYRSPRQDNGYDVVDHFEIDLNTSNEEVRVEYRIRLLIATRKRAFAGMGPADTRVEIPAPSVFALIHAGEHDRTVVTIHNLASEPVTLSIDGGHTITLLLNEGTTLASDQTSLDLAPHGFAWWAQDGVPQFSGAPAPAQYESEIVT